MKKLIVLMAALTLTAPLYAQTAAPTSAAAGALSDGVVRKIDTENNKITLKHGPITNLDMPGMTMVFRVVSPTLLNGVKVGDAVKFHVEKINGSMTITAIKPAQ